MTRLLRPFSGFVPSSTHGRQIVGPPSSLLTYDQKMALRTEPLSFRHSVGRGARAPYEAAMAWLVRCIEQEALQAVDSVVIVYRLSRAGLSATGVIGDVSLEAYDAGHVKRHEATIAKTQSKMIHYMESTRILGNPVALAHRDDPELSRLLGQHTATSADVSFEAVDGAHHSLWLIGGADAHALCDTFSESLYITDGHHRLSAASALAAAEGWPSPHLPAALFAESEQKLGAYARVIQDDTVVPADLIRSLRTTFGLTEVDQRVPQPRAPREIGVRLGGQSFVLEVPPALVSADPYDGLDVNLLQDLILEPLFGISNPRTDPRLGFAGDTPNADHDVDACDAWFLPYPAAVRDVMSVADSGRSMPPKSTYFMPKVPSGLAIRLVPEVG